MDNPNGYFCLCTYNQYHFSSESRYYQSIADRMTDKIETMETNIAIAAIRFVRSIQAL